MNSRLSNPNKLMPIHIVGRFPPPIDGQSLATQSLFNLLQENCEIQSFNMMIPDRALLPTGLSGMTRIVSHYLKLKPKLKERLADGHPVLWTSISSQPTGHWRDLLTILPCLNPDQSIIAVVHWGIFAELFTHWATRNTISRLVDRVSGIVVLGRELANQVVDYIPEGKLHIIPNYVEPLASEEEIRMKQKDYESSKVLKVLFLSHMIPQKGCYVLLEAIAMAIHHGLPIEAHFAGRWNQSEDEEHFRLAIHNFNLSAHVTLHGPIENRRRVAELHRSAHVFALPTVLHHEAQPLALMEALSAATPVITTRRPVLIDLVGSKQGAYLVPPFDPSAIADALFSLNNKNIWLKNSQAARARYETVFSPEVVRASWINLIQGL